MGRISDFLQRWTRNGRAPLLFLALAAALSTGGCATTIALPAFIGSDSDVTGSIPKPVSPLSSGLDEEDWRRAQGALAIALDPQGNGLPVTWDNPKSGAKGSFAPVGDAYARDSKICRAFVADLGGALPAKSLTGTGCRSASGDWDVSEVKPWKKA